MDKIIIKGLKLFAYHGVNPEEKQNGQNFVLDAQLHVPLKAAGQSDALSDTVNYAKAVKLITAAFRVNDYDLIEKAATEVAESLLEQFPKIEQVDITLKKPEAPIKAEFEYVAVQLSRRRGDFE